MVADVTGATLPGVRVNVKGDASEATNTDSARAFALLAHAVADEQIRLHVESEGFQAKDQYHRAGINPPSIVLERQ